MVTRPLRGLADELHVGLLEDKVDHFAPEGSPFSPPVSQSASG